MNSWTSIAWTSIAWTSIAARLGLGTVFLVAALSKLSDFTAFASVVSRALAIAELPADPGLIVWLTRGVVMLETFLAAALIAGVQRWWLAPLAALALGVFTIIGVALLLTGSTTCGCMRLPPGVEQWMSTPWGLAARNTLLIIATTLLGTGRASARAELHAERGDLGAEQPELAKGSARLGQAAGAFTLIEMIAVIAIVGVLIGLSLPALAAARARGVRTQAMATMSDLVRSLQIYGNSNADSFPYPQVPHRPWEMLHLPGSATLANKSYFMGGSTYWPNMLREAETLPKQGRVLSLPATEESNRVDGLPDDTIRSRYLLTHTAFAAPGYWETDQPPEGNFWFAACKLTDTLYPSEKGLLLDIYTPLATAGPGRRGYIEPIAYADGSVSTSPWNAPEDVYPGQFVVERPYGAWARTVLSTRGGLAGRDPRR